MPSVWIAQRKTASGDARYRVMFRTGGRETPPQYGGSFKTLSEAKARQAWARDQLASMRVPDITAFRRTDSVRPPSYPATRPAGNTDRKR